MNPCFFLDFIISALCEANYGSWPELKKESLKTILVLYRSMSRSSEYKNALQWFSYEKDRIINKVTGGKPGSICNKEAVLLDHLEGREDPLTKKLMGFFGG